MKLLLSLLIRLYQCTISPLIGPCCRFYPSCSNYALSALKTHSLAKACVLTTKRIFRCCAFHPGGYDPVPPKN